VTDTKRQQFLEHAGALLGPAAVKTSAQELEPYSVDWRKRYHGKPLAALFPHSTQQVADIVRLASQHQIALVPQGGNTGLSGGATPDSSGTQAILSLSKLRAVRAKDPENKTLTVEAGVTLQEVQDIAQSMNLLFPLSLGSQGSATIGGNLATNAGGTAVLRYGNMRDLCLGVEVVTANSEIWNGLRGLRKDNTGYDLRDLFIGSEGTLGIITAAVLTLFPRPAASATALAKVQGPAQALQLLQIAQTTCDATLTGFEYMSAVSTDLVSQYLPEIAHPFREIINGFNRAIASGQQSLASSQAASVLLEISHPESQEQADTLLQTVMSQAIENNIVQDALLAQSMAQAKAMWHLRESITLAAAQDGAHIKHDIALPISALTQFITEMNQEIQAAYPGIRIINFGHFGDGNLHYNIAPPAAIGAGMSAEQRHQAHLEFLNKHEDAIRLRVHDRVVAMNGSISAEHGLGQLRRDEARRYKSPQELDLMRAVKYALDPQGILNPGKVL
jgi:FAD/FMN-containing dehydrogenase